MRFVIIRDDNDVNVQQWSLSHGSFIVTSILIVILCAVLLSFTAELMTRYLYQAKLRDIRDNNASLTSVFVDLQTSLSDIQDEMEDLEEKDKALRTYANLPPIDQDIRQVGVGGYTKTKKPNLSELFPGIEEKINNIEMDISELSRKVRLEKESYTAIYNTIKDNSQRLTSIPSIRPLNGGYLNTGIGYRNDPFTGEKRFHHGLDISANRGTAVYATANGKVVSAG
ncbi:MAG: M23 family metallopeptidase, partial [Candidatus Neomarinimicrobiota bacterium]